MTEKRTKTHRGLNSERRPKKCLASTHTHTKHTHMLASSGGVEPHGGYSVASSVLVNDDGAL